jgi:hypothetical protein
MVVSFWSDYLNTKKGGSYGEGRFTKGIYRQNLKVTGAGITQPKGIDEASWASMTPRAL